ncbi:MAG: ferrochelatase [Burkholderiales bacterium]|nr:ferrochelatase [Burkholderiales bacterium]
MNNIDKLVLLVNLGSPKELNVPSIKKFLREFLSDKRVVGLPRFIWYPILYLFILPFRSKKLLSKYSKIWHESGLSPLDYYTRKQVQLLDELNSDESIKYDYAYSYGHSTISEKLDYLSKLYTFKELVILPLYPQYSSSTTAAVFDSVANFYSKQFYVPKINFINSFFDNDNYINLLANKVLERWQNNGISDRLIVSFHSLPERLIINGDTYKNECELTFKKLCEKLKLSSDNAILCYQSKFGKAKWITPSTESLIKECANNDLSISIICPGFISDCLETLEEVQVEYREVFESKSKATFDYIACLNDDKHLSDVLLSIIR